MTDLALSFSGVTKRYGRRGVKALDGLSFEVPRGALAGLVGPNGAGKTTTFGVVSGFLEPDEGTVDLLGAGPFDPHRLKGRLGVLPQDAGLPPLHTPTEFLTHLARLQGLSAVEARRDATRQLERVRLGDKARARIRTLSHGMRRRVSVASALIGRPELVLLDEPTAGLDPVQARSLRDLLAGLRGEVTLVVSSHNLDELERLCDWVVMMDAGRCVRQGSIDQITGRGAQVTVQIGPGPLEVQALHEAVAPHTLRVTDRTLTLSVDRAASLDGAVLALTAALVAQGIALRSLRRGERLEDRFLADAGAR